MLRSRPAARSVARQLRAPKARQPRNIRFASTEPSPAAQAGGNTLGGAAAGATAALAVCYGFYHFSGAKTVVNTASQAQSYVNTAKQKFAEKAPEPNEALDWLRDTAKSYAAFIPGAKGYVDTMFEDLDKIRSKHGDEFDKTVRDAYNELKEVSKKGDLSAETAFTAWNVLQKYLNRLFELSGDAMDDILDNHPQIKEKVGGSFDQLKQMGDQYGPQAKEEVNKTWQQISDVIKGGVSAESITKIQQVIKEKREKLQEFANEAWKKGMEEAKPYLDKNPKVKEIVEENADALKKGNFMQLWSKIKDSVNSGNTEDLEKYIKGVTDKAKSSRLGNMDKWLNQIPGGAQILPALSSIQAAVEKKGPEAEKILKETIQEIKDVLSKRKEQADKLASEAKDEAKK